jgi:hypothetical protein
VPGDLQERDSEGRDPLQHAIRTSFLAIPLLIAKGKNDPLYIFSQAQAEPFAKGEIKEEETDRKEREWGREKGKRASKR